MYSLKKKNLIFFGTLIILFLANSFLLVYIILSNCKERVGGISSAFVVEGIGLELPVFCFLYALFFLLSLVVFYRFFSFMGKEILCNLESCLTNISKIEKNFPLNLRKKRSTNGVVFISEFIAAIAGALDELNTSTDYFDSIIRAIQDSLIVTNRKRIIKTANPVALEMLGYQEEELIGKSMDDIAISTDSRKGKKNLFQPETFEKLLERGYIKDYSAIYLTKSGGRVPVSFAARIMESKNGAFEGLVCVAKDVREYNAMQSQLAQSSKLAALGTMSAGIAHELKNPLAVIVGKAELNLSRLDKGEPLDRSALMEDMKLTLHCSEMMVSIVDHLRIFSREGKEKDWHSVSIEDILNSSFILLNKRIEVENINVIRKIDKVPRVWGDRNKLVSVFQNLVSNSIDAFASVDDDRKKYIKVSVFMTDRKELKITFEDNALGMDRGVAENIFNPFFTTKGIGKGTGLGLSLSYGFIEEHKGSISVVSTPGKGSTFSVILPVDKASETHKTLRESIARKKNNGNITPHKRSGEVLFIEDYPPILDISSTYLKSLGYTVYTATNGAEGAELASKKLFDIIITDINMPVMNGYEAAELIRKTINANTPIVAMTANTSDDFLKRVLCRGINDALAKPVRRNELYRTVDKWILPFLYGDMAKEFGSEALAKELLGGFIKVAKKQIPKISKAISDGDTVLVHREAHSMKGGAGNIFAYRLMFSAASLESAAKSGNLGNANEMLDNIGLELEKVEKYARKHGVCSQ